MTAVSIKVPLVCVFLFSLSLYSFGEESAAPSQGRFLILYIGGGLSSQSYGAGLDSNLESIAAGNKRTDVIVDFGAGIAISNEVYVLLKANGFSTRVESTSGTWSDISLIIEGGSIRFYPDNKAVFIEIGGGAAQITMDGAGWTSGQGRNGFAGTGTVGFSYTRDRRGLYVSLAGSIVYSYIEGEGMYGIGAFVSLDWEP